MSWLFGIISPTISDAETTRAASLHDQPRHVVRQSRIFIASGGLSETSLFGLFGSRDAGSGWIVLGLGLRMEGEHCVVVTEAEWAERLSHLPPRIDDLDGHFVAVIWNNNGVQCLTDSLGLRVLYYAPEPGRIVISSRLDWLARFTGRSDVDYSEFGSSWLTFHQLSSGCTVRGLKKLGQGGVLTVAPDMAVQTSRSPWKQRKGFPPVATSQLLRAYSSPILPSADRVSLGLSGGMDSRLLLSALLERKDERVCTHTFGEEDDPDVRVAAEIARYAGMDHLHLNDPLPVPQDCIRMTRELQSHLCVTEPASSVIKLRHYPSLRAKGRMMVDGGFGEIGRRQYFNRLLRLGRKAVLDGDPSAIFSKISVERGGFFVPEVAREMHEGTLSQINARWEEMPRPQELGVENWVDLLAVRTRVPNFGGPEQSRLDGLVLNYMPLVQPSFLHGILNTPLSRRRNGRWARKQIRESVPGLTRFPLVKSGATYPFYLSGIVASLSTVIRQRLGTSHRNTSSQKLLIHLSEFVRDTVSSLEVTTYSHYDQHYVRKLVADFYGGRQERGPELDWWLAFELWRQSLR